MAVLNEALQIVLEYFTDDLPEVGEVDRTDPFSVLRFLKNYLNWANKTIFNEAQNGWKGGKATDFTRYIRKIWLIVLSQFVHLLVND